MNDLVLVFFYGILPVKIINNVEDKIILETQKSLEYAHEFMSELDKYCKETGG